MSVPLTPQDAALLRRIVCDQIAKLHSVLAVLGGAGAVPAPKAARTSRAVLLDALRANPGASVGDLARVVYGSDDARNRNRLRSLMRSSARAVEVLR
jgi:hypothetical protein